MTRENKLALIIGFSVFLVFGVLVGDYFSKARNQRLDPTLAAGGTIPSEVIPAPRETLERPLRAGEESTKFTSAVGRDPIVEIDMTGGKGLVQKDVAGADADKPASAEQKKLPVSTEPEKTYAVVAGDSLYKIAQKSYGDGSLHQKLAEYNKDKLKGGASLSLGQELKLPPRDVLLGKAVLVPVIARPAPVDPRKKTDAKTPEVKAPEVKKPDAKKAEPEKKPEADKKPETRSYTVVKGDVGFESIARKVLGDAKRHVEIAKLNPKASSDALQVGQVLILPAK